MKWIVVLSPIGEPLCKGIDKQYSERVAEYLKGKTVEWELHHELEGALPTHFDYLSKNGLVDEFVDWSVKKDRKFTTFIKDF